MQFCRFLFPKVKQQKGHHKRKSCLNLLLQGKLSFMYLDKTSIFYFLGNFSNGLWHHLYHMRHGDISLSLDISLCLTDCCTLFAVWTRASQPIAFILWQQHPEKVGEDGWKIETSRRPLHHVYLGFLSKVFLMSNAFPEIGLNVYIMPGWASKTS